MAKKKAAALPGRAWRQLRVALLWVREGGVFKRGMFLGLRVVPSYLKSLKAGGRRSDRLHFGEREFSFEETPAFHFKTPSMWLLRIPCITPAADFDTDDDDLIFAKRDSNSYLLDKHETEEASEIGCENDDDDDNAVRECEDHAEMEEADEIDRKAEQFIARFYQQMKMQRQISLLQDNEMLHRGVN
ncbi:long cell-linked locus protein [Musa troglodytarum]|uniref:Long cell-linked locus protein n=1 Tax=Musa troglodytarum TaxID=320322 RepID=A0A9E7JCH4_9LILI|nr:long cell-linked locus protein [Musa troglodytarum]